MERYVGLDVHAKSCRAAVIDARGKQLSSTVLETNGRRRWSFCEGREGASDVGVVIRPTRWDPRWRIPRRRARRSSRRRNGLVIPLEVVVAA